MYQPIELATFALSEFERHLDALTDEEAQIRLTKSDNSQMNAISWISGHVAAHWIGLGAEAERKRPPSHLFRFVGEDADPTPIRLIEALSMLGDAKAATHWIKDADSEILSSTWEEGILCNKASFGTTLMRATIHTWAHIGEVNAIRQMLGHSEIDVPGPQQGKLEWK